MVYLASTSNTQKSRQKQIRRIEPQMHSGAFVLGVIEKINVKI